MTAISSYAPPGRNSLMRRSFSAVPSVSNSNGTVAFAFFLVAVRFWAGNAETRQKIREILYSRPWGAVRRIKNILLSTKSSSENDNIGPSQLDNSDADSPLQRIRNNQLVITSVLKYWFGSGTPDQNQKHLWMIAASSEKLRMKVDKEITDKFESILLKLVGDGKSETSELWSQWCMDRDGLFGANGKIATIIVLDQFSRHIRRHYEKTEGCASKLLSKETLDSLAFKTSQLFVETHKEEIRCGMIPIPMYIFALMPYRHTSTIETLEYVQNSVEECASMNFQIESMLGRFRKATNRRLAVLQDEERRQGKKQLSQSANTTSAVPTYNDEDILETFQFDADMAPAVNQQAHKVIANFLIDRGIRASLPGGKPSPPTAVIVSLSGGVDSMVIASVLSHLNKSCGYNLKIIAVHIDYGNRPESSVEADFVGRYCKSLDIKFRCRKIDEVTRGVTSRDDYERISRNIRYDSYREAVASARGELNDHSAKVGVMLGHHRGDLRENVLSNAHKGSGPLDLSGMTSVSQNDSITIYRPLLPLEKNFIFEYAHAFGVPYFKDTTPHWSTRGKLRNKLIPLLKEIYGEGSMNNLSNLASESDECRALLNESLISPFLNQIVRKPMGIIFDTAPWKEQAFFFWKFVLRAALHSAKLGMFTDKSVISFLERVKAEKVKAGWLQCRKDYGVYLQADGKVFVLYSSSFPWNKKDFFKVDGEVVEFGNERQVGPWTAHAEIVSDKDDCPEKFRLGQKAIQSMEHLMDGFIEYFIESPTWQVDGSFKPRPLAFVSFKKPFRPAAWKSIDLKVQSTLPLLGNDATANGAETNPMVHTMKDGNEQRNPTCLVKVVIKLNGQ